MNNFKMLMSVMLLVPILSYAQHDKDITLEEEVEVMTAHVESLGQIVKTGTLNIPMAIYLLQNDKEDLAVELVLKGVVTPFVSTEIDAATLTDYQIAISFGFVKYYQTLLLKFPEKVNEPLLVSQGQDKLPLLSILALSQDTKKAHYENMVRLTLKAGGLPKDLDALGLSAFTIAASFSNHIFINIVTAFEQEQLRGESETIFINPPLTTIQLIEEQSMIDAYLELSAEEDLSENLLMEEWFNAVVRGYNTLAEIYYHTLSKNPEFNVDSKTSRGLTTLQATCLSSIYGGNVSYAKKLLDRGANVHQFISVGSGKNSIDAGLIDLALTNDNHKVIAIFIKNSIGFLHSPNDKESILLVLALQQEAYKSAIIIKTAVDKATKHMLN